MNEKFRSIINQCDIFLEKNYLLAFHCANGIYLAENYVRLIQYETNDYPLLTLENVSLVMYNSNNIVYKTDLFSIAIDQIVGLTAMSNDVFSNNYK